MYKKNCLKKNLNLKIKHAYKCFYPKIQIDRWIFKLDDVNKGKMQKYDVKIKYV